MWLEALESRVLMALSVSLNKGQLVITGSDDADTINISIAADQIKVDLNSAGFTSPLASVRQIRVNGGRGDDRISVDPAVALPATLQGGGGDDRLQAGGAPTHMAGGPGNDFLFGGSAADVLSGGPGIDTADYSARNGRIKITLDGKANDGAVGEANGSEGDNVLADIERVIGGTGNDSITGSAGRNTLQGGGGNDTLVGARGDDLLIGGPGNDLLQGCENNDILIDVDGSTGDTLDGGPGYDVAVFDSIDGDLDHLLGVDADVPVILA